MDTITTDRVLADADDLITAYGYVWLPYAVAAVLLAGLAGWHALHRARRPDALARELPVRVGALALLAAVAAGLADDIVEGNGLTAIDSRSGSSRSITARLRRRCSSASSPRLAAR